MVCKQSRSGRLRHKITIQKRTESIGATGGVKYTWANHSAPRAEIGNKIGREKYQAMQEQSIKTVGMRLHYTKSLGKMNTRDYRIIFKNNIYDIEDIDNVLEMNKELIITTSLHNAE